MKEPRKQSPSRPKKPVLDFGRIDEPSKRFAAPLRRLCPPKHLWKPFRRLVYNARGIVGADPSKRRALEPQLTDHTNCLRHGSRRDLCAILQLEVEYVTTGDEARRWQTDQSITERWSELMRGLDSRCGELRSDLRWSRVSLEDALVAAIFTDWDGDETKLWIDYLWAHRMTRYYPITTPADLYERGPAWLWRNLRPNRVYFDVTDLNEADVPEFAAGLRQYIEDRRSRPDHGLPMPPAEKRSGRPPGSTRSPSWPAGSGFRSRGRTMG